MAQRLKELVQQFKTCRIMVVGDFVADEYHYGICSRLSREAPVPVLKRSGEKILLGGAANAVHNLLTLGAKTVLPVGLLGADASGVTIMATLTQAGVNTDNLIIDGYRHTTTKTRIMASSHHTTFQQIARLDSPDQEPLSAETEDTLITAIKTNLSTIDALLVSDYGHGVFTDKVVAFINQISAKGKTIVAVDSRFALGRFSGATVVTPNEPEAVTLAGKPADSDEEVLEAAQAIKEKLAVKQVILTRGNKGMLTLDEAGKACYIPVQGSDEVADVTGAGDTVISTVILALAGGASLTEAATLANGAGGLVVMKNGTATISQEELLALCPQLAHEQAIKIPK